MGTMIAEKTTTNNADGPLLLDDGQAERGVVALLAEAGAGDLEPRAGHPLGVETFECTNCGAAMGSAGGDSDDEDDLMAQEYFDAEVERHRSGGCAVNPTGEITTIHAPINDGADVSGVIDNCLPGCADNPHRHAAESHRVVFPSGHVEAWRDASGQRVWVDPELFSDAETPSGTLMATIAAEVREAEVVLEQRMTVATSLTMPVLADVHDTKRFIIVNNDLPSAPEHVAGIARLIVNPRSDDAKFYVNADGKDINCVSTEAIRAAIPISPWKPFDDCFELLLRFEWDAKPTYPCPTWCLVSEECSNELASISRSARHTGAVMASIDLDGMKVTLAPTVLEEIGTDWEDDVELLLTVKDNVFMVEDISWPITPAAARKLGNALLLAADTLPSVE